LKTKALRLLAGKCTLAARVDSFNDSPDGLAGKHMRAEIEKKIEKWQEPPPPKQPKPLAAPDDKPKKRRGGKRIRKMKEKFAPTELRKITNRIPFAVAEETFRETGKGFGMLGLPTGSGKVRVNVSNINKPVAKKQKTKHYSSGSSGLSSSVAFTSGQGLELGDPSAAEKKIKDANEKYFSSTGGFFKTPALPIKKPELKSKQEDK